MLTDNAVGFGGFMSSGRNQGNSVNEGLKIQRVYKKPTLKRHGLVSELTQAGGAPNPTGADNYVEYAYS